MDLGTSIGIAIALLGLLSTLIGFIIKLSVSLGDAMSRLTQLEKQNEKNTSKFEQLYNFKSETQVAIAAMSAKFDTIMATLNEIKNKIDK